MESQNKKEGNKIGRNCHLWLMGWTNLWLLILGHFSLPQKTGFSLISFLISFVIHFLIDIVSPQLKNASWSLSEPYKCNIKFISKMLQPQYIHIYEIRKTVKAFRSSPESSRLKRQEHKNNVTSLQFIALHNFHSYMYIHTLLDSLQIKSDSLLPTNHKMIKTLKWRIKNTMIGL